MSERVEKLKKRVYEQYPYLEDSLNKKLEYLDKKFVHKSETAIDIAKISLIIETLMEQQKK